MSPSPPAVAAKSGPPGATSMTRAPRSRPRRATCEQNVPAEAWFLPCTSLATAPPSVTKRLPGSTGTVQPRGTARRSSALRLVPASARTTPASQSAEISRSSPAVRSISPPEFSATSP